MTTPVTHRTISTEHLLRLDAQYPAARWWLHANREGDMAGPVLNPLMILEHTEQAWSVDAQTLRNMFDGASIGVMRQDLIALIQQDLLVQEGLSGDAAAALATHLLYQLNEIEEADGHDALTFGYRPVFFVTDDGAILPPVEDALEVEA